MASSRGLVEAHYASPDLPEGDHRGASKGSARISII
jgi:hypothetical protein